MRIPVSNLSVLLLACIIGVQALAANSVSSIQSLQGEVWIHRGDKLLEVGTESEVSIGDSIYTTETGHLTLQLWSQLKLVLDPNSQITIIPATDNTINTSNMNVTTVAGQLNLDHGSSCIQIDHSPVSPIRFDLGNRASAMLSHAANLCLSTNEAESHVKLIQGSVEIKQSSDGMIFALNQPGSEIRLYTDGNYKLIFAPSVPAQIISTADQKVTDKAQDHKATEKTGHQKKLYNVYLFSSRSYDTATMFNRRIRDAGYKSTVVDEIDDKGALFSVVVLDFNSLTAARTFIQDVAVTLGIDDAWIARQLPQK